MELSTFSESAGKRYIVKRDRVQLVLVIVVLDPDDLLLDTRKCDTFPQEQLCRLVVLQGS